MEELAKRSVDSENSSNTQVCREGGVVRLNVIQKGQAQRGWVVLAASTHERVQAQYPWVLRVFG